MSSKPIWMNHAGTALPRSAAAATVVRDLADGMVDPDPSVQLAAQRRAAGAPDEARAAVGRLVNAAPERVHLTASTTMAMTVALRAFLHQGDRVVTTDWDHFALARPLMRLERERGVKIERVPSRANGSIDVDGLRKALRGARLLAVTHACNVTGDVFTLGVASELARAAGAALLVDAAASAGAVDIDVARDRPAFVAFGAHKRVRGFPGVAALVVSDGAGLAPFVEGSVAGFEALEDLVPEGEAPPVAGTPDWLACAAFAAAAAEERRDLGDLARRTEEALARLDGWTIHGASGVHDRVPIFALTPTRGTAHEAAARLEEAGVAVTWGTCNAPWIHRAIGTTDGGVLRISPGEGTTEEDIGRTVEALAGS